MEETVIVIGAVWTEERAKDKGSRT